MENEALLTVSMNWPAWRRPGSQTEVRQDAPRHLLIFDHRDQSHGACTSRTEEHVEAQRPLHQGGPRKAPCSDDIIWASEFRCRRPVTSVTGRVTDRDRRVNSLL